MVINMTICKEFIIKDLFDYMIMNDTDILDELSYLNLSTMVDLVKLSYKCSDEEAENVLYKNIDEYGIEAVAEELAYEVIGHRPDKNEETHKSTEYKSFFDILESFYNDIQAVDSNLTLSEFMSMSTRYMFRYAEGIQTRFINNENKELRNNYMLASMILSGLAGELKECPQLNEDGTLHKKDKIEEMRAFFAERRAINEQYSTS